MIKQLNFDCCFCDNNIKLSTVDPCNISILINIDKDKKKQYNQNFWCHLACFRKILHANILSYLATPLQG